MSKNISSFPLTSYVYFDSHPINSSKATKVKFDNQDVYEAFLTGLVVSDDYFGYMVVPHKMYKISSDGDAVEMPHKSKIEYDDKKRFIIWGENPEKGTRPEEFSFKTKEEAEFFMKAVDGKVTTSGAFFVPDKTFKPFGSRGSEQDLIKFVDKEVKEKVAALIDEDFYPIGELFFVNKKGDFVSSDWEPSQEVSVVEKTLSEKKKSLKIG